MVYIQSDSERTLPHHFDAACALYGAKDNGQTFRLTSIEEISSGKFDALIRQHLFVGSVEFMTEVFSRIGKVVTSMPPSQASITSNLKEAKLRIADGQKFFIKPTQTKLFSGMVFDTMTLSTLDPYPDNTEVLVSLPFEYKITSEWRCYIRFNKIIDARNYSGDFKEIPNFSWAETYLSENDGVFEFNKLKTYPSAFTMDLGVLENGRTVIIEYNDMWAIGNYGIDNSDYYKLLRERYFEIIR